MDNPISGLLTSISNAIAPGLKDVQAQASDAADQLNTAFQVIIAEGAIIIALLTVLIIKTGRK